MNERQAARNALKTAKGYNSWWTHYLWCKTCRLATWLEPESNDHFCATGKRLYEASMKEAS